MGVMANFRDPNIPEISESCKSVETAYNYAKNCGLVVDVSSGGAQIKKGKVCLLYTSPSPRD